MSETSDSENSFAILNDGSDTRTPELNENSAVVDAVGPAAAEVPPPAPEQHRSVIRPLLLGYFVGIAAGALIFSRPVNRVAILACDDGWTFYNATGKCYKKLLAVPFYEAQFKCSAMGGNLTSILSEHENQFLTDFATSDSNENRYAWIGLHNPLHRPNEWRWIDGAATKFKHNDPEAAYVTNKGFCAVLKIDFACGIDLGAWLSEHCNVMHHLAICSKPVHFY